MSYPEPSHPGESIQMFCIDDGGLTVAEAAAHLQVSEQDLLEVCQGREPITADLAIRLDMAFGGNARVWLELQLDYDLAQARKRAAALRIERIPEPDLEPAAAD